MARTSPLSLCTLSQVPTNDAHCVAIMCGHAAGTQAQDFTHFCSGCCPKSFVTCAVAVGCLLELLTILRGSLLRATAPEGTHPRQTSCGESNSRLAGDCPNGSSPALLFPEEFKHHLFDFKSIQ